MTDSPVYLRIDHVTKRFGETVAVNDVSLGIERGEIFALLGSSGCGKSTLLRVLSGFETPTSGRVWLDGKDVTDLPPYERPMNMMFQSYALFPHLNVWENVAFGLKREGCPKDELKRRVGEMLELVQLAPYARRKPHQLSGGQQQRVAIARALAMDPSILLCDEITSALDPELVGEVLKVIRDLAEEGRTMILVTHEMKFARRVATHVVYLHNGLVEEEGPPQQVLLDPRSERCRQFVMAQENRV